MDGKVRVAVEVVVIVLDVAHVGLAVLQLDRGRLLLVNHQNNNGV